MQTISAESRRQGAYQTSADSSLLLARPRTTQFLQPRTQPPALVNRFTETEPSSRHQAESDDSEQDEDHFLRDRRAADPSDAGVVVCFLRAPEPATATLSFHQPSTISHQRFTNPQLPTGFQIIITGVIVVAPGINLMAFAYGKERNVTAGSETLPPAP